MKDLPARLHEALTAADYTYASVTELLGAHAQEALERNETTPALAASAGGTPVETLVRMFLLQTPVSIGRAEGALPGLLDALAAAGIVEQSVGQVAARLDVRPYATDTGELWLLSDLTPGLDGGPARVGPEHVLGASAASTSLAQLTMREQVGTALDLGTGCGVQALHLAEHADAVVATDVNKRALGMARFNAQINAAREGSRTAEAIEVRAGSYFTPVRDERFDLIATNPPFVISPATGERLVYRDSGLPGDRVVADIVREAPSHLAEGGWCQILANWIIEPHCPWEERMTGWLSGAPEDRCDLYVVQREVVDPARYVELWLADAGVRGSTDYLDRYDTWLSWFAEQGIEAIGFGWINLHRGPDARGEIHALDWPYEVEQPIGSAIADWAESTWVAVDADSRLVVRPDVQQVSYGAPGAADPETITLRQQRGFRRARTVDTLVAGFVGACDGDLTVGQIASALAELLDVPVADALADCLTAAADLTYEGYLTP